MDVVALSSGYINSLEVLMRVLYIDIDSLRPDHLGCYGYPRATSPRIDALAAQSVRFTNCYVSDAPCLPSRTALFSGRSGFRTGVINHGGRMATPINEGRNRGDADSFGNMGWMALLRAAGLHTVTVSSFGERHAAWHWYAGFSEIYDPGGRGNDHAHAVNALALPWLARHAAQDNWFLHVNYWDPHTPYTVPLEFGDPFANDPLPAWLTEDKRQRMWDSYGPHSAQEPHHFGSRDWEKSPRIPQQIDSLASAKQWIDGYDTGVRYADAHVGQLLDALADAGVLDETVIVVSADHGENLGELNVWGDHQTADHFTCCVPLIMRVPGIAPRVDDGLHYAFDWAATLVALAGGDVPQLWDGQSFAEALRAGESAGRDFLVMSQGAWSCQRAVRADNWLYLRTYDPGLKPLPEELLFDLNADPYEEHDLSASQADVLQALKARLLDWHARMVERSDTHTDPMVTVLREGGPFYTRDRKAEYAAHLRATGRAHHAEGLR